MLKPHVYRPSAGVNLNPSTGESAKQVDKIFDTISSMCEEDPDQFNCVLIDEVESIAGSREASQHGEVQDSLRATNALLTGLDRTKKYSNIIFLCTSNMLASLDSVSYSSASYDYSSKCD